MHTLSSSAKLKPSVTNFFRTDYSVFALEGRPKRANPIVFQKLWRPYVLIAIQHPSIEDGSGIHSQPALFDFSRAIPLLFQRTTRLGSSSPPRCGIIPSCSWRCRLRDRELWPLGLVLSLVVVQHVQERKEKNQHMTRPTAHDPLRQSAVQHSIVHPS